MSAARRDAPTLAVVVIGGIGVILVIAFVGALILGSTTRTERGDRLAVVPSGDDRIAVLAARCGGERVRAVEVRVPDGPVLWRIESAKGGIDRSYVVGGDPLPFGFDTTVALQPLPAGPLQASVTIDDATDVQVFERGALERGDGFNAPCGERDVGPVTWLFAVGAAGVVGAYAAMVRRWLRDRSR